MKLIIAGSRTLSMNPQQIQWLVEHFKLEPTEIVCGGANGIDDSGEMYGMDYAIPVKYMDANWDLYGKRAGHIRNAKMAAYGNALLLIWDGKSKGSMNMKENMVSLNKPIYEVIDSGQLQKA